MSAAIQIQHEFYNRFRRSERAHRADREREQHKNLLRLLQHANREVPFYKGRLNAVLRADDTVDWNCWSDIPIVRRTDLLDRREEMLARSVPKSHGAIHEQRSSGSTGARITVSHTDLTANVNRAALYRAQSWHGIDWSKDILYWWGENFDLDTIDAPPQGPTWGPMWMSESTGKQLVLNRHVAPADVLTYALSNGVAYMSAKPNSLHALARASIRRGIHPRLRALIGYGTGVHPHEQRDCLQAFGAEIIAAYSAKEGQHMAYPCPQGIGYHVSDDTVLLEIVDEDGQPVKPGEIGRVVITPIFNFAQPLIRYDQGDLAVRGAECGCGRTLSVIQRIVGRTEGLFHFPDGSHSALSLSFELMEDFGALFWQIAQIGPLEIEVRYIRNGRGSQDRASVANVIRHDTGQNLTVSFREVTDLERPDGRKFIPYVCELP